MAVSLDSYHCCSGCHWFCLMIENASRVESIRAKHAPVSKELKTTLILQLIEELFIYFTGLCYWSVYIKECSGKKANSCLINTQVTMQTNEQQLQFAVLSPDCELICTCIFCSALFPYQAICANPKKWKFFLSVLCNCCLLTAMNAKTQAKKLLSAK